MSRARNHESANAVQLFPFIAVLLCTMGALLVVLVAVTGTARERARQEAEAVKARAAARPAVDPAALERLRKIQEYLARLQAMIDEAKQVLRDDQLQLSHLEDHMRRLQQELDALKLAAADLNSLEESHFDDREQAQRELERLRELIAERKLAIEELRKEQASRQSYAILPYKTPSGTRRPPVCFECSQAGVSLQPQGIKFTPDDFRGPPGPGSPIAAAFRAAREEMTKRAKASGQEAVEPYALVVVRPGGQITSAYVLKVLEAAGIDFGYELIEKEAAVQFPPADPQVTAAQYQAILTARGRLAMLASAAPRMYESASDFYGDGSGDDPYGAGEADYGELAGGGGEGSGGVGDGGGSGGGGRGTQLAIDSPNRYPAGGSDLRDVARSPGGTETGDTRYATAPAGTGTRFGAGGVAGGPASVPLPAGGGKLAANGNGSTAGGGTMGGGTLPAGSGGANSTSAGGATQQPGGASSPSGAPTPGGAYANGASAGTPAEGPVHPSGTAATANARAAQSASATHPELTEFDPHAMSSAAERDRNFATSAEGTNGQSTASAQIDPLKSPEMQMPRRKVQIRGKDWAIHSRTPGSVPIRRTIRVAVRGDSLAILPEQDATEGGAAGREIPLIGKTSLAGNEFSTAIDQRIKSWGMAGDGLYWRPVIELVVAPDGRRRADDLVHLLQNSGIEVKAGSVAQNSEERASHANR